MTNAATAETVRGGHRCPRCGFITADWEAFRRHMRAAPRCAAAANTLEDVARLRAGLPAARGARWFTLLDLGAIAAAASVIAAVALTAWKGGTVAAMEREAANAARIMTALDDAQWRLQTAEAEARMWRACCARWAAGCRGRQTGGSIWDAPAAEIAGRVQEMRP